MLSPGMCKQNKASPAPALDAWGKAADACPISPAAKTSIDLTSLREAFTCFSVLQDRVTKGICFCHLLDRTELSLATGKTDGHTIPIALHMRKDGVTELDSLKGQHIYPNLKTSKMMFG